MSHVKKVLQSVLSTSLFLLILADVPDLTAGHRYPKNLIFIGDSISDMGNAQPSTQIPAAPYPVVVSATPITNGLTFAGLLGNLLEVGEVSPSTQGGLNFAYAGALTLNNVPSLGNPGLPLISLYNQVDLIPKNVSKEFPVISFGGANDFLRPILDGSFVFPTGASVADNMVAVLKKIKNKGFETQIISNMPNLGELPFIQTIGLSGILTPLSEQFNAELKSQLQEKSWNVVQIDTFSLFSLITDNPDKYGFPNGANVPAPNANLAGYMFYYDGVHPSEALDKIFAEYVYAQFEAASCVGNLAEIPFSVMREQNTAILQQLYPLQPERECNGLYPFLSGSVAPLFRENTFGLSKEKGYGGNVLLGFSKRYSPCFSWGLGASYALSHNRCNGNFNSNYSNLSSSLFGSYNSYKSFVNVIATGSWLDFTRINRHYNIGPVKEKIHGNTNGQVYYGQVNGGYNLYECDIFSTGPIASVEYGVSKIDGYKEHGADVGNLKYRGQIGHAFITGLGWEVNLEQQLNDDSWLNCYNKCLPAISEIGMNFSLSVNRQWLENRRKIYFKEVSINGSYGALPYEMTRTTYFSGTANFYAELCNKTVVSAGYFFNVGSFNMSEQRVIFGISMPFGRF